jgi:DNA-binding transcriptional ArsR family regulator
VTLEMALKALADPARLSILRQVMAVGEDGCSCNMIAFDGAKATLSHHMKILRDAGLIHTRQEGTRRLSRVRREEVESRFPGLLTMMSAAG